jgi:hypothetical protein
MTGFLRTYAHESLGADLQTPMDVAVVIPTVLRPTLRDALYSVFTQDLPGRIQVLIGVDAPLGDLDLIDQVCTRRPENCVVQVYYPGYSTSVRHGGLHPARDGGVLRSVLSYLANARHLAYLDDDNWWSPEHLRVTSHAISAGAQWAATLRWFVHPLSRRSICVDRWESVGPGQGLYAEKMGGFVDPNCLMINKVACGAVIPFWTVPLPGDPKAMSADRHVFDMLHKHFRYTIIDRPTVYYQVDPLDGVHPIRLQLMGPAYDEAA